MAITLRPAVLLFMLALATATVGMTVGQQATSFATAPGSPLKIDGKPTDLIALDANGDGAPDLLAANAANRTIDVLLGDGRGGFRAAAGSPFATGESGHLLAAADFNSDKRIDIALTGHDSNGVTILLGDGAGAFKVAPGSPFAAFTGVKPHNHGLAAGDVNGDGRPDLTLGHQEAGGIAVLLGDGRGGFAPAQGSPFRIGSGFYPHALGDMNRDGNLDVVAPDIIGSAVVVALGDGRGAFALANGSPVRVKPRPFFVLLDDVNGDARLDAVVPHDDIDDVDVLLGDGRGGFIAQHSFHAGHLGWTTVAADLNADGRKDLIIAGAKGLKAFLGSGTGSFTPSPEWSVVSPRATWKVAVADFNRDRRPDVAFYDFDTGAISVMLHRN